jgi:predicted O-methyltransferase YrrM
VTPHPSGDPSLEALWPAVDAVPGWLTRAQAEVLWHAVAVAASSPVVVEIGSHHGRSTLVLASARADVRVTAVDPFVTARLFAGPRVRDSLEENLRRLGVDPRVDVLATTSRAARAGWSRPVDVLYIDGKHDYRTVSDDLHWAEHVRPGSPVLVHDAFSSIGVTLALLRHVLPGDTLRYEGRTGSLARFVVARPGRADRVAMLAELPWWARNVVVKVLLRLRATRAAALLGHAGPSAPS